MEIFMVGGAVRDALLGLPVSDRDWVVVGSSPEEMDGLGYAPVGKDFPVFLHPKTHEEYALARTERKTARGYKGFAVQAHPGVTLEQDLARRDLTINAMAIPQASCGIATGDAAGEPAIDPARIIDPFHGLQDLKARVLRHVTPAFREDPVRILRVARLAARFTDFQVADETVGLMRDMVTEGEVDHLVPERVWQELSRGLCEPRPSRMFEVLRACGALARLLPEVDRLFGVPQTPLHHPEIDTGVHVMMVLDTAARLNAPLTVRYACLGHDLGKGTTAAEILPRHIGHEGRSVRLLQDLQQRLRIPADCRELAEVVAREHGHIHDSQKLEAEALLRLLERCDALRKPQRFSEVLLACRCDALGRLGFEDRDYPQARRLHDALDAVLELPTAALAAQAQADGLQGPQVGQRIHAARVATLRRHLAHA